MENLSNEVSLKDIVLTIKAWIYYLRSKMRTIIGLGILGAFCGFGYSYFHDPIYVAETTFVLEDNQGSGGLSSYIGIASMVGIDLSDNGGGVFQGDNILQLYQSRRMIQQALLSKDTFENKRDLLINRLIDFKKLREAWAKKDNLKSLNFDIPSDRFTLQHDSIIGILVKEINDHSLRVSKVDKKLSIIKVEVSSNDELFSRSFTNKIVQTVNNFYVQTKTKKSAENLSVLQHQADSVKRALDYSIRGVAVAADINPNSNQAFQILRVPSQRKQVDVQASSAIYQEIVKNLELAKVSFRHSKPLIQVIDSPILPLRKIATGRVKASVIGSVLFGVLTMFCLLVKRAFKSILK